MRSGMIPWAVVCAAVLLSVSTGVAQESGSGKLSADLAMIPRDGTGFVSVRVAELWKKADALHKLAKTDSLLVPMQKELSRELGLSIADVERAVVIFPDADSLGSSVVVLTLVKPYDLAKTIETIVPGVQERKIGDRTFFGGQVKKLGFYPVDNRTFLVGSLRSVENFFRRSINRRGLPMLNAALAEAARHDVVLGLNLADTLKNPPPGTQALLPVLTSHGATVTMDFTPPTLKLDGRFPFASADAAREAEQAARQGFDQLQQFLPHVVEGLVKSGGPPEFCQGMAHVVPFFEDVQRGLKGVMVTREGKEVRIGMSVMSPDPATNFVYTVCTFLSPATLASNSPPPPAKPGARPRN